MLLDQVERVFVKAGRVADYAFPEPLFKCGFFEVQDVHTQQIQLLDRDPAEWLVSARYG